MQDRLLNAIVGVGVTLTDTFKYPKKSEAEITRRALENTEREFIKRKPEYAASFRKQNNSSMTP